MEWRGWAESLLLALLLAATMACGRQPNMPAARSQGSAEASHNQQTLPFEQTSQTRGVSPSDSLIPSSRIVPAGTPVTIRLQSPVSSAIARSGDPFEAVLDEPIMIEGQTLAPGGAPVQGRVLAAKSSGRLHNPGYLRLTLTSITINGRAVPVKSSSIFAKGGSHERRNWEMLGGGAGSGALIGASTGGGKGALMGSASGAAGGSGVAYATGKKDVDFAAERRLTFRVSEPLDVRR